MGKSYLVGSGGLRLSELFNFSGRHPIRRRRRSGARPAPLLHERQKRSHNTRRVQKNNTAPPKWGDLSTLLPPTDKIVSEWRDKKCHAIGNDSSKYKLQEIQEIAEQRKISALSTRNREKVLAELRYASTVEEWKREKWQREEKRRKKRGRSGKGPRSGNFKPAKVCRGEEKNRSKKLGDSCNGDWHSVWGDTKSCGIASRQKMGFPRFSRQRRQSPGCIAAWKRSGSCCLGDKRFAKILLGSVDCFRPDEKDSFGRQLFWLVSASGFEKLGGLELHTEPSRSFQNWEGKTIVWNPIQVVSAPDSGRLAFLRGLGSKCQEYKALRGELAKNCLQKISAPGNKMTKKTTDLPEGEYICKRFATTTFRNAPRTILFLLRLGKDGEQATDEETPTHGVFLEKEIAAMGGIKALEKRKTPLRCLLGEEKTTPSKRKCRRVALA